MWVYYPDRLMDQDKLTELLSFSKAKGIGRLYLCLNYTLIDNMPKYRPILEQFISAAGRQGRGTGCIQSHSGSALPKNN